MWLKIKKEDLTMKKLLPLVLALMLLCSTAQAATLTASGFPVVEGEPETLSILIAEDTLVTSFTDNAFTRYLEDSCNVHLEFQYLPATDTAQKLNVMINSGEKLPDVICYTLDYTAMDSYARAGALLPLDELYENCSVNFKKEVEAHPELKLKEQVTGTDGHIYALPRYFVEVNNIYTYRLWTNKVFLENLNMETPATTEEFYEYLKAVKEKDANLNGDPNDEIPLTGANSGTWTPTTFLMNSFVYAPKNQSYRYEQDGKVTVSFIQDGWKEGLKYMHKLWEEELMDHNVFTQASTQARALAYNEGDVRIVGAFTVQNLRANEPKAADYFGLMPPKGPEGVQYSVYAPTFATPIWMLTKDCANPELAFRVGDFCFTEEAFLLCRVGEEGVSWIRPEPGTPSVFPDLYEASFVWIDNEYNWSNAQNAIWRQMAPLFALTGLNGRADLGDLQVGPAMNYKTIQALAAYKPDDDMILGFVPFTEEESKQINDVAATVNSFAEEYMVLFITGELDIDSEWDAYLEELNGMGLQEYLAAYQAAYERSK